MNTSELLNKSTTFMQVTFWRCIAAALGWAVRWRPSLSHPKTYMPYIGLAIAAYWLGRVVGGLLMEVGLF